MSRFAERRSGRKRLKRSRRYLPTRGVKLVRRKKFEPVIVTAAGVNVRSRYEKLSAEFLFRNHITFQYEPLLLLGNRQYRPDFFLPEYNLFLEICGYAHMPFYADRIKQKKLTYDRHNLKVVFINYDGKGSLEKLIRQELENLGIKTVLKQSHD